MRPRKYMLLPLLGLAAAACGGEGEADRVVRVASDDAPPSAPASAQPEPAARPKRTQIKEKPQTSIGILRPRAGRPVQGPAVTVSVGVEGFEVVEQRVRPPFPSPVRGKGHVHYYLDTKKLPRVHGSPATGAYRSLSSTTYTWPDVPPGRHTFAVQLVGKDHVPLSPQVKDRITLRVR